MMLQRTLAGLLILFLAATAYTRPPDRVVHLLQNDLTALLVVDSVLIAAGNNSIYTAVFDTSTQQFMPNALADYAGPAAQIKIQGTTIVIRSSTGALTFVDAAALPLIVVLGTVFPPVTYRDFSLVDSALYLACEFEGLRAYRISGTTNLNFRDSSLAPIHAIAVVSAGASTYVVDDYTGLFLFQPAGDSIGTAVDTVSFASSARGIALRNDSVFVSTEGEGLVVLRRNLNGLNILDTLPGFFAVSTVLPTDTFVLGLSPSEFGADLSSVGGDYEPLYFDTADIISGGAEFVSQSEAYFVWPTKYAGLSMINLTRGVGTQFKTDEASPIGGDISDILISDSDVIVSRSGGATLVCGIDSVDGRLVASPLFSGLGGVQSMAASEGTLYLLNADRHTVVVAQPSSQGYEITSFWQLPADDFYAIRVTERIHDSLRLLAALSATSVELVKISDDGSMTAWSRLYFPEKPGDVTTIDSTLVIGGGQSAYVYSLDNDLFSSYESTIYSTTDAGDIVRVLSGGPHSGRLSIVSEHGLQEYDISNPSAPLKVGAVDSLSMATDADRDGDNVYVATQGDGLLRIVAPLSGAPAIVDSVRLVGSRVKVSGSRVALASSHGVWLVDWGVASDVLSDQSEELPSAFRLAQNYPNPFNPGTTIEFTLDHPARVNLEILNMLGQIVRVVVDDNRAAGTHRVPFDATGLASGMYLYRLSSPGGIETRKMVLLK